MLRYAHFICSYYCYNSVLTKFNGTCYFFLLKLNFMMSQGGKNVKMALKIDQINFQLANEENRYLSG